MLVTSGIYSFFRHPSYVGWIIWSVSTQLVLGNFICFIGFIYAGYVFFKDRIPYEEETLLANFGDKYVAYMKEVPASGIPGI